MLVAVLRQLDKKLIFLDLMRTTLSIKSNDDSSKTEFERSAFRFPKNLENALLVNSFGDKGVGKRYGKNILH